jgi:hypothetical protein
MGIGNIAGILSGAEGERIEATNGQIRERTIEFGDTVIAIGSIGSMTMIDGTRNHRPTVVGVAVFVLGGMALGSQAFHALGLPLVIAGLIVIGWSLTRKINRYLSIGTCDGRRTHLVSTDRNALLGTRNFIRKKIDEDSAAGATIINGGIAIGGTNNQVGGAGGDINNGGAR